MTSPVALLLTLFSCFLAADAVARSPSSVPAHKNLMSQDRKGPMIPSDSYFTRALSAGSHQNQTWSKKTEQDKTSYRNSLSPQRRGSGWSEEDASLLSGRLRPPTLASSEVVYFSRAATAGCFPTDYTGNSSSNHIGTIRKRSSSPLAPARQLRSTSPVATARQQRPSGLNSPSRSGSPVRNPDRTLRAPHISSGAAFYSEIVSHQQRSLSPLAGSSVRR